MPKSKTPNRMPHPHMFGIYKRNQNKKDLHHLIINTGRLENYKGNW